MSEFEYPELTIVREPLTDEEMINVVTPLSMTEPIVSNPLIFVPAKQEFVPHPINKQSFPKRERRLVDVMTALSRHIGQSRVAFTSLDRLDGIGAQAVAKITTRVMALALNQDYAHAEFDHLEHCVEGLKQSEYCRRWEDLLQIGGDSTKRSQYHHVHNLCSSDSVVELYSHNFKVGHLYCFRDANSFVETYRDELKEPWRIVIQGIRARYYSLAQSTSTGFKGESSLQVAVHIRRGDVIKSSSVTANRWLDDEYYMGVMKQIEKDYLHVVFDIVSEGSADDFQNYVSAFAHVRLHISPPNSNNRLSKVSQPQRQLLVAGGSRNQHFLNRRKPTSVFAPKKVVPSPITPAVPTVFDAFQVLVSSDVLIMSRSLFSLLAGLYSKGKKIYPPGLAVPKWCEENDSWFSNPKQLI